MALLGSTSRSNAVNSAGRLVNAMLYAVNENVSKSDEPLKPDKNPNRICTHTN